MKTVIEMAREVGMNDLNGLRDDYSVCVYYEAWPEQLEHFAELVRADERDRAIEEANRRANTSWTLMCEKMVSAEREQCAKVCDRYVGADPIAATIRARSNT